ncbi:MAG: PhnD/SsuA/transferrin family substrate-binding protein [Opitutaceae bacterium]
MSLLNLKVRVQALATRWGIYSLAACAFVVTAHSDATIEARVQSDADEPEVRIILSSSGLSGVNVNDTISAFRVWTNELTKGLNMRVSDTVLVLDSVEEINRELDSGANHLVSLSISEYLNCGSARFSEKIYIGKNDGKVGARYLLLVRDDAPITELGDLSGKKLVCYDHRETSLSDEWFQYQLMQADLKPAGELLQSYSKDQDLSKTVLGVFFGNQDACIVSDSSFELLCELNPQLKARLRVLMQSPQVIGGALFTQVGYDPELEVLVEQSLDTLGDKISGHQILTLFRSNSVIVADLSELAETIGLYKKWIRTGGDER